MGVHFDESFERDILRKLMDGVKKQSSEQIKVKRSGSMTIDELLKKLAVDSKAEVKEKKCGCGNIGCHNSSASDSRIKTEPDFRREIDVVLKKYNRNMNDVALSIGEQEFQKATQGVGKAETQSRFLKTQKLGEKIAMLCVEDANTTQEGKTACMLASFLLNAGEKAGLHTQEERLRKAPIEESEVGPTPSEIDQLSEVLSAVIKDILGNTTKKETPQENMALDIKKMLQSILK